MTLESPDSLSVGTYIESNKALHGKGLAMIDYSIDVCSVLKSRLCSYQSHHVSS